MKYLYDALRDVTSLLKAAHEVLGNIAAGDQRWEEPEWEVAEEQHTAAFKRADEALKEWEGTIFGSEEPLKITNWIACGAFVDEPQTLNQLYEDAGRLLDKACSYEIFEGDVVFECENGKTYCLTVEGSLMEANPKYVEEVKQNQIDNEL